MKILKLTLLVLMCMSVSLIAVPVKLNDSFVYSETPAKTIVIKASNASDLNSFFAGSKSVAFEIYKAGTSDEVNKMIEKMKAVKGVESVTAGKVTGDYTMIQVSLSANKDKAYWAKLFKTGGLTHIKANNNPIVEIDKM